MTIPYAAKTLRLSALVLCAGAAVLAASAANAGSCPKDKVLTKPQPIRDAPDKGVEREILSMVDLSGWRGVKGLMLRTRRLTVAPHGIVPTHQHDDRPSIVYVVKGEIVENSALCSVPILHKEGEWTPEFGPGHAHWWENKTDKEVILTSSDVVPPEMMEDKDM